MSNTESFGTQLTCSVDEGALRGLQRKEGGGRLLPAGVVRVEGPFASHQAVKLVVRRRKRVPLPNALPSATSDSFGYDSSIPSSPNRLHESIGETSTSSDTSPSLGPQPSTPTIHPAMSLSSSIASLDPLSRSVPPSPAIAAISEKLSATTIDSGQAGVKLVHELAVARGERSERTSVEIEEWEEVEVGKGLAHYNSVEIDRIKGMKR